MQHINKGKKGEELAAEFLMKRGYSILRGAQLDLDKMRPSLNFIGSHLAAQK